MDGGKIVGGIVIVLAVATGPLWVGSARGVRETPAPPRTDAGCVEPREQMLADHPALLANWREQVVRLGQRNRRSTGNQGSPDGRDLPSRDGGAGLSPAEPLRGKEWKPFEGFHVIGLTRTCLGCHGPASQFCDRCHAQQAVSLSCWQCHSPFPQER